MFGTGIQVSERENAPPINPTKIRPKIGPEITRVQSKPD
jgi:hypothetical protein